MIVTNSSGNNIIYTYCHRKCLKINKVIYIFVTVHNLTEVHFGTKFENATNQLKTERKCDMLPAAGEDT